MNAYCVICSDRFVSLGGEWDIAAGTCGHTFHSACLATWLESSRTCPTCRKSWGKKDVISKLYFDYDNTSDEPEEICTARLLNELNSANAKLIETDLVHKKLQEDLQVIRDEKAILSFTHQNALAEVQALMDTSKTKNEQIRYYQSCEKKWIATEQEYTQLKSAVQNYSHIKKLIQVTESESKSLLENVMEGPGAPERLANLCAIIKREYEQCKRSKKAQRTELEKGLKRLASMRVNLDETTNRNQILRDQLKHTEEEVTKYEREILALKRCLAKREESSLQENNDKLDQSVICLDGSILHDASLSFSSTQMSSSSDSSLKTGRDNIKFPLSDNSNDSRYLKITTASKKRPKLTNPAGKTLLKSVAVPSYDRSPQVPILQNFMRGYDGFGGHTSFSQSLSKYRATNIKPLKLKPISGTRSKFISVTKK